jgi:hypothetical protein
VSPQVLGVFPSGDDLADYRRLKLAPPKGASGKAALGDFRVESGAREAPEG